MALNFVERFFEKFSNTKFKGNFVQEELRFVWKDRHTDRGRQTDGEIDKHDEANSRFSHFLRMRLKT
jgi:hypothetical protein